MPEKLIYDGNSIFNFEIKLFKTYLALKRLTINNQLTTQRYQNLINYVVRNLNYLTSVSKVQEIYFRKRLFKSNFWRLNVHWARVEIIHIPKI